MPPSAVPTAMQYNPGATSTYTPYNQQGNQAIANAQSALSSPAPTPTSAVPAAKGNWFTHLLPTLGSIAAPVIGGLLAPETGGLSLLASLALAGGGSAAGKAAEDVAQGQKINPTGLLESGAEGAAGQGLGMGASSILGGIGGKLTGALGDAVEGRVAQAAASQAAQETADEAARVGSEFASVKPGQGQVGPALDKLTSLGIEKPTADDMVKVGSTYTGSNPETGMGVINAIKQRALDQAGGEVNLDNTMNNLHTTLASPENQAELGSEEPMPSGRGLPKAPNNVATKIVQQVRNMLPEGSIGANGQITTQLNPQDGFTLLKDIGNQITQTTPKMNSLGVLNPADVAENNVWKSVYSDVKGALYNRPEVDAAVQSIKVGPDEEAMVDDALKQNGITDPQVATNIKSDLINTINNSSTAQDLLDAERPMVNVSRVGKIAQQDQLNNPQLPRNVRAAKVAAGAAPPPDTPNLSEIPTTHAGVISTIKNLATSPKTQEMADKLIKSGVSKKVASAIPLALTGASQFITHAGDQTPNAVNLNLGDNNMNPQSPLNDPNSLNSLLLQLAIAESANPTTSAAGSSELNQLVPQIQNANIAQNSLLGAEQAYQQAGGGQGGILGNIAKFTGMITGNPVSQYEQQRQQLINQLTPLGIPTSAVPQVTGNNQSGVNQFQTLQNMINAKLSGGQIPSAVPTLGY